MWHHLLRLHNRFNWEKRTLDTGVNLNDAGKLADPEYRTIEPKITTLSGVQPRQFKEFPLILNQLNIKFKFYHPKKHFLAGLHYLFCSIIFTTACYFDP